MKPTSREIDDNTESTKLALQKVYYIKIIIHYKIDFTRKNNSSQKIHQINNR